MRVIAHGGAGSDPTDPEERQQVLDEAARAGAAAGTAVAAVVTAVRRLEASPRFNAGRGGAVQTDGVPRTDAGLMTDDRSVGAACAMPGVLHAVEAARVVKEETPHVLVAGEAAVALADAFGVATGCDLWTDRSRERWEAADPPDGDPREQLRWARGRFGGTDTVGAVAADAERVAAATSTGGRWFALAGRVGDVPQVGSGFYCGPAGGASATGAGEDIARVTLSRRAVALLDDHGPEAAADRAVEEFDDHTGSTAGVILMDTSGRAGSAFNSDTMQTSVAGE